MLPLIGGAIGLAIAGVLGVAAARPGQFRIERSTRIKASPDRIYPLLDDFHRWGGWSPWEKLDPDLRRTYSGAERGPGAVYHWVGNKKVGEGQMEITGASAPTELTIKLDFLKPFEAHNITHFTLRPDADATAVTWAMTGTSPYMMKVMGVFVSMDRLVGRDFEAGLANLKAAAEA
jgi:hypothetical protein